MPQKPNQTTPLELALHRDMAYQIKSAREALGLSTADVSRITGIMQTTISRMEDRTDTEPQLTSVRKLCTLANALDLEVEIIIRKRRPKRFEA